MTLDRSAETTKGHWWFLLSNINGYLSFYRMDEISFRSESTTKHLSIHFILVRENTWMSEDLLERRFIVVQQLSFLLRGIGFVHGTHPFLGYNIAQGWAVFKMGFCLKCTKDSCEKGRIYPGKEPKR